MFDSGSTFVPYFGSESSASLRQAELLPPPPPLANKIRYSLVVGQQVFPAGPGSIPGNGGTCRGRGGDAIAAATFYKMHLFRPFS